MYCFDTDILSAVLRRDPPLHLIRRHAVPPPSQQFTTAITCGEMIYGAAKHKSEALEDRIRALLNHPVTIVQFDEAAAERCGRLRAALKSDFETDSLPDVPDRTPRQTTSPTDSTGSFTARFLRRLDWSVI